MVVDPNSPISFRSPKRGNGDCGIIPTFNQPGPLDLLLDPIREVLLDLKELVQIAGVDRTATAPGILIRPFGGTEYAVECAVVYAPNGRCMTGVQHLAGKGACLLDTPVDMPLRAGRPHDEKGSVKVDTLGGSQLITVQHVPDEWRGKHRLLTPAVDNTGAQRV